MIVFIKGSAELLAGSVMHAAKRRRSAAAGTRWHRKPFRSLGSRTSNAATSG